jgi:pyruvate formate lyase activating enzyme
VAALIELWGCSFACKGCLGTRAEPAPDKQPSWPEIVQHIHNHGRMLDSIIVTGGEPLEDPDLPSLLAALSELGLDVLVETNGSRPDVLSYLLAEDLLDGIALDVKAVPARYRQVSSERDMAARVAECADMLIASGIDHEFRTVLHPGLVTPEDLPSIARTLQGGRLYTVSRGYDCDLKPGSGFDDATLRAAARASERFLPTLIRDLGVGAA